MPARTHFVHVATRPNNAAPEGSTAVRPDALRCDDAGRDVRSRVTTVRRSTSTAVPKLPYSTAAVLLQLMSWRVSKGIGHLSGIAAIGPGLCEGTFAKCCSVRSQSALGPCAWIMLGRPNKSPDGVLPGQIMGGIEYVIAYGIASFRPHDAH